MDPIVTAALVGTGQRPAGDTPTTPEVDALVAGLPEAQPEPALLLQAGAWAVYKLAGASAEVGVEVPAPAPEERLQPCSPAAAELLSRMFSGQYAELLPEACERMRRAGLRLPHHLLPPALAIRDKDTREALVPLLGERGRWLARFNKAWSWVNGTLADGAGTLPDDAETLWQEGTPGQRVEVLRRLRAIDPARAREWLADAWKREKADLRADLLATLVVGLSAEDEPLLESALDDRSERVSFVASGLLARLSTSALAARMRERADALLRFSGGKLAVSPPHELTLSDQRDGLRLKPQRGMGERAWWLAQTLKFVPLSHWEDRFGAAPADIVAAADKTEWSAALIEGWSESAVLNGGEGWIFSLWLRCKASTEPAATYAHNLRASLARQLPREEIEAYAATLFDERRTKVPADRIEAVQAIPAPWSASFGEAYLQALQRALSGRKATGDYSWSSTLRSMAAALPPDLLDKAADACNLAPDAEGRRNFWAGQVDIALDILRGRQHLLEVLPL